MCIWVCRRKGFFFFNVPAATEIYTLSLHDALPIWVTLTKKWGRPSGVSPTAFAGWQLTAGGLFLVPVTFLFEGPPPAIGLTALIGYLWLGGVGGLLAYVLWFRAITTLPVTSVSMLGLLSPMVAALLGVVVLGQTLNSVQLTGFTLALAAIVASQRPAPVLAKGVLQ